MLTSPAVIVRKGFRFRLKPTPYIREAFLRAVGCSRFVWNRALALEKTRLEAGVGMMGYAEICAELVRWKKEDETSFLSEVPSQALQQTLKDLDRAIREGLTPENAKGFPRFKKKGRCRDAFRYPQGVQVQGRQILLPKIGWVRFYKSRPIEGIVKNVTVSRECQHWYVSIQTEREVEELVHPSRSAVGIDMGVVRFATLSDGTVYRPRNAYRGMRKQLARAQRCLARRVRFSNNWQRQKRHLQRIHRRIADSRRDFLHKVSTTVSKNHATVVLEKLRVKEMSASARGTKEAPRRNVRAKAGLNKAILDQGWYEFRRILAYKETWAGGRVILVDPEYTSLRCTECGSVARGNRPSQPRFQCIECGFSEHADLVAARNILAVGHTASACGGTVESRRPTKQEPARSARKRAV